MTTSLVAYNNRNLFFHSVDARILKSRSWQSCTFSKGSKAESSPLPASHLLGCGWITPISASVFMWLPFLCLCHLLSFMSRVFCLLGGRLSLNLGPNNPGWSHLENLNYIYKDPFPKSSHTYRFWGKEGGNIFWGATVQLTTEAFPVGLGVGWGEWGTQLCCRV